MLLCVTSSGVHLLIPSIQPCHDSTVASKPCLQSLPYLASISTHTFMRTHSHRLTRKSEYKRTACISLLRKKSTQNLLWNTEEQLQKKQGFEKNLGVGVWGVFISFMWIFQGYKYFKQNCFIKCIYPISTLRNPSRFSLIKFVLPQGEVKILTFS